MTIPAPFWARRVPARATRARVWRYLAYLCLCAAILFSLSACLGDSAAQQPDPRLKDFHVLSSRIVMMDNQAEVDGTVQNTGHDQFPFDVTIDATFYDSTGNVIGSAEGVAEDIYPGTSGPFTLQGQIDSGRYSHMSLTPVSLRERRVEQNLPTPPPVVP
jgi:hypothetical protein